MELSTPKIIIEMVLFQALNHIIIGDSIEHKFVAVISENASDSRKLLTLISEGKEAVLKEKNGIITEILGKSNELPVINYCYW